MTQPSESAPPLRPDALLGKLNNTPQLPPHFLPRPDILAALKETLLLPLASVVASGGSKVVGLHSMGGSGKSVLVAAPAREEAVRHAFPDGVLWVTLGQTPALTTRQAQLAEALDDEPRAFEDPQQGRAYLSESLANRACLLILDDAWQVAHVRAFNGPRTTLSHSDYHPQHGAADHSGSGRVSAGYAGQRTSAATVGPLGGPNVGDTASPDQRGGQECGNLHANAMNARQARKLLTTLGHKALLQLEGQAPQRRAVLHSLQHDYLRLHGIDG